MSNLETGWLTQEVAAILRGARARQGVTQAALARVAGVSQSQVSKMLLGKRAITVDQLDRMCHELKIEMLKVISEADEETTARFLDDPTFYERTYDEPPSGEVRDLPARTRKEMQLLEDVAARDEKPMPDLADPEAVEKWLDED